MKLSIIALLVVVCTATFAEPIEKRKYKATILKEPQINIDGKIDEPAWKLAQWENDFIQHEPVEGNPPTQQTEFAILYDEANLYVAIKALDKGKDISMRMSRRDDLEGDLVGIYFDTYNDQRTSFNFIVSAAGVKSDALSSNDGDNEDFSWDAIWWVKTSLDKNGWVAEMRIPLTQLRFENGDSQLWGFQVLRYIFRKEELSVWQPMKRENPGFVSQFGQLNGISGIKPQNTLALTPYVVARTDRFEKETDNPFLKSGKKNDLNAGFDAKIGLTNYLTLDLTVNPDFGQVEADPSEVNLTTYETFFPEKRPFFVEGKNILTYKLMFGDGDLAYDGLFYSRRIGRRPHYYPDLEDGEYTDIPEATRILGAAKITGKTKTGWSIGVLESVTAKENAKIRGNHINRKETVEPFTNYFVARVQKDFNKGNTYLGGMVTSVNRNIKDSHLDFLHKNAYSGGIDFVHKWADKKWEFDASAYFSHVTGSTEAITNTQESFLRIFQRPDASYLTLDTTRTSLSGQGGKLLIGKLKGNLKFMGAIAWKSPGLELNDVGYMQSADDIFQVIWVGYRFYKPFWVFREANLNFNQWLSWDFGGNLEVAGGNINWYGQFKNYWRLFGGFNVNGTQLLNSALRGGPALKIPGYKNIFLGMSTNQQKKIMFDISTAQYFSNEKGFRRIKNFEVGVGYRPMKTLNINISPEISTTKNDLQYVTQKDYNEGKKYIFAHIDRKTLNMSIRLDYNITPDLSVQFWGQPFIASGKYSEFKYITNSKAPDLTDRYNLFSPNQVSYNPDDEEYRIDDNLDGNTDYSFGKPDFNFKEFLSNMVVRWEYKPGSTLYLVWSQNRNSSVSDGSFDFNRDIDRLFKEKAYNIFLIKLSYRLGR